MSKEERWTESFQEIGREVSQWREKERQATFNEIENNVDGHLAQLRAQMIQDLVGESELVEFKELEKEKRPKCPVCGRELASNGQQKRKLMTKHEQVIEIERSKGYCRHCRVSYFPPG